MESRARVSPGNSGCTSCETNSRGADLFVLGATWSGPDEFNGDFIGDFDDGLDFIDLRGTGLTYEDLTIDDSLGFAAFITSSAGKVEVRLAGFQEATGAITEADFLFG
jgi:hypothetical protein